MSQLRVFGLGSPFGDDQLGWSVVESLQQKPALEPMLADGLQLQVCDRPGLLLLELMRGASCVYLIDAVKTGVAVGTFHRFKNEEIVSITHVLSTHAVGLGETIKIGRALNELPPEIVLYGIEIGDMDYQFKLSLAIQEAIKEVTQQIEKDILSYMRSLR
jgi:hydrogenase maturation protease